MTQTGEMTTNRRGKRGKETTGRAKRLWNCQGHQDELL